MLFQACWLNILYVYRWVNITPLHPLLYVDSLMNIGRNICCCWCWFFVGVSLTTIIGAQRLKPMSQVWCCLNKNLCIIKENRQRVREEQYFLIHISLILYQTLQFHWVNPFYHCYESVCILIAFGCNKRIKIIITKLLQF